MRAKFEIKMLTTSLNLNENLAICKYKKMVSSVLDFGKVKNVYIAQLC